MEDNFDKVRDATNAVCEALGLLNVTAEVYTAVFECLSRLYNEAYADGRQFENDNS